MIQNFEGRKFWWNSLHQKLAENILANAQNCQTIYNNNYVLTFCWSVGIIEYSSGTYHTVKNFGGENCWQIWRITAICQVFVTNNFHNFHSITYGFTIACCPSMLGSFLGLLLLFLDLCIASYMIPYGALFTASNNFPYTYSSGIA